MPYSLVQGLHPDAKLNTRLEGKFQRVDFFIWPAKSLKKAGLFLFLIYVNQAIIKRLSNS